MNTGRRFSTKAATAASGNARKARENYAAIIPIDNQLLAADATNQEDLQNLAATFSELTNLSRKENDHAAAIEIWRKLLDVRERVLTITPDNPAYVNSLAGAYFFMAGLYAESAGAHVDEKGFLQAKIPPPTNARQVQQWREARSWYEKSLSMYQDMKSRGMLIGTDVKMPDQVAGEIAKCDAVLEKVKIR